MNDFSKDNDINIKLNNIFENRFDIDLFNNKQDIHLNDNLLGHKLSLRARDLMYLLDDVEKKFDITISDDDIDNIKFNTINNIVQIINKALQQKVIEAI